MKKDFVRKNLTEQEKAVLYHIIKGNTNPKIAELMGISIHTVKIHIESIYRKLEVHSKVQAVVCTLVNNLIDYEEIRLKMLR